ncbi:Histone deacetylase hda1 [Yamadazyma tenuis]|uniref:Histone deacetylase hda1 n=1 Tax=Candida tenuis TaxID=2315449 RepID=UPI0027A6DA67|nr:Histone deacetylase hda1 [Yamadazyma tenuis]
MSENHPEASVGRDKEISEQQITPGAGDVSNGIKRDVHHPDGIFSHVNNAQPSTNSVPDPSIKAELQDDNGTRPVQDVEESDAKRIHLTEDVVKSETPIAGSDAEIVTSNGNGEVAANGNGMLVVPKSGPQLFYTPLKTGLVYDVRMRYHAKIFTSYFEYIDPHPEDPRRIYRIYKKLAEAGLITDPSLSGTDDLGPLMMKIPIREASDEEILLVHSEEHLKYIASTETMSRDKLLEETETGDSIYVNNDSYLSAKLSCGGSIEACKAVISGQVKNSMAIVRPPGHHAEPDTPGGFCLFSNVAVAAKTMLKLFPDSVRKIVIVDWDIHHGNGTQKAFYNDPRVLYISLHRYENGRFYPGTKAGSHKMCGEEEGEGFNMNIPWRAPGTGDGDYVYAFNKLVIPVISEFDPDFIIVSSGFDAADGDIVGGCHVTPAGYGYMTHMLKGIARGKLSVILEGGYNLDSISKSALAVAKVLLGEPPESTITQHPFLDTIEVVDEVIKTQSKYWTCLKPGNPSRSFDEVFELPEDVNGYKLTNINDPIRSQQANHLFNLYSFINLPIVSNENDKFNPFTVDLPPRLEDLIVASPHIYDAPVVVVTVHDPPDIWANVNSVNGNIEGNSSVVLEHPLIQIIEKIKKEQDDDASEDNKKIGYIDINIPSFTLPVSSNGSLHLNKHSNASYGSYNPNIFAQELLLYVWDNYLSYFNKLTKLIFVGFGDAYQSIVHLYAKRPSQEIKEIVKGTVCFVNRSTLKPLVPVMDESMIDWFYSNSVIFTSCLNPCWTGNASSGSQANRNGSTVTTTDANGEIKRPRRKFGRVIRADVDGIWEVISERFDEGVDFILDSIEDFEDSSASN